MIRILTTHTFSAPLLRAQAQALARHMTGTWELTVVNDAQEDEHFSNHWRRDTCESLEATVASVGARHIRFPQEWHDERWHLFPYEPRETDEVQNANTRCADAVQFGVNVLLGESYEPLLIIDADMVPYRSFDPAGLLKERPVWGVSQVRGHVRYLWNGLILVDPQRAAAMGAFDLNCAHIDDVPCDVGGMLYRFVAANKGNVGAFHICSAAVWANMRNAPMPPPLHNFFRWDVGAQGDYRISETYGSAFAHLGGGGNWEVREQAEADERMRRFIEAVS